MHKFVSSVEGRLVSRLGTPTFIGARATPEGVTFEPETVVALTRAEWDRYGATYAKHVRARDLRERTLDDFEAFLKAQEAAEAKKAEAQQNQPAPEAQEGDP